VVIEVAWMLDAASIFLSLLGFSIFSAGMVLTKAGGAWLKWAGPRNRGYYKALAIWLAGFLCYNLGAIPTAIASRSLPPHIISACSGFGISIIILLSCLLLKERLYPTDLIYSVIMIAGIAILSILDQGGMSTRISATPFYILLMVPFILLIPGLIRGIGNKPRAIILAIVSGSAGGFALVIMNVVMKNLGSDVFASLNTPYPYLYVLFGILQFVALQLAMRKGSMILIGPLQNALMILYPAACSYFIFGTSLGLLQITMIAVIVMCCIMILRKH
jgi:drug/metabolite transporter (DMT)-like permease